jgi:hypothetical protein
MPGGTEETLKRKKKLSLSTDRGGLYVCAMSRIAHFLDNRLADGGEVASLTRRPRFTPRKIFWYSVLLEAE